MSEDAASGVRIIPGADHFCIGLADQVAGVAAGWLAEHLT